MTDANLFCTFWDEACDHTTVDVTLRIFTFCICVRENYFPFLDLHLFLIRNKTCGKKHSDGTVKVYVRVCVCVR